MSQSAPSRALDPVYGGSCRKGVYRATSKPASTSSSSSTNQKPTEGSQLVSGTQRVKFHHQPVLPHLQVESPEVLLAPVASVPIPPLKAREANGWTARHVEIGTRSVGMQTLYRDSESQTNPYTPDYKRLSGLLPEIATLAEFSYAHGQLPIGHAELNLIERNRHKRAFEASLPPLTDEASFLLRKAMLQGQETREWAYRDAEIDAFHAQRVALLDQALREREKENAVLSEQRLEVLYQRLLYEKENALETLQQERVTALRKLLKQRAHRQDERGARVSKPERKRDIIADYANFGSHVYAPVLRDGKAGQIGVLEQDSDITQGRTDVEAVERAMPARMLVPAATRDKPRGKTGRTAKERKQAAIEAHLVKVESMINKSKTQHGSAGDAARLSASGRLQQTRVSSLARRAGTKEQLGGCPRTPDDIMVGATDVQATDVEDAVRLLQKLMRGRAVQSTMNKDKERQAELMAELRAADNDLALDHGAQLVPRLDVDPNAMDRVVNGAKTCSEGEGVSEVLDLLSKERARSHEVAQMRGFVIKATEEQRVCEVEDGGRRQAEELMREERKGIEFQQVMEVHAETSRDLVDSLLDQVVRKHSHAQALQELSIRSVGVDRSVLQVENDLDNDAKNVVCDLVASVLLSGSGTGNSEGMSQLRPR